MLVVAVILFALFILYLLSVNGRRGHPELAMFRGWKYAHRGLHEAGCPENSLAAFRNARDHGYGVELDVHLLADGNLAVVHDSFLERMTGSDGRIEDLTLDEMKRLRLAGTEDSIPELSQVLDLFAGSAPLIIELKAFGNNHRQLCENVCSMLEGYNGVYCLESFDPRCIYWLKKHRPDLVRGQLTENYFKRDSKLPAILKFILTHQMLNFLTKPDFIAYRYPDCFTFSSKVARKLWKLQGVTWTLVTKDQHDIAVADGWIPIFEGFVP